MDLKRTSLFHEHMEHTFEIDLGGHKITIETGKLAKQANGSVVVRSGDSVVLVTACANENPKPGQAFFPLTVDYREYTYAAGRFPGGFIKREGRPSEKEILTSRMIDRPMRPLFPEGFMCETQIIAMVLSADPEFDPAVLGIIGAAASLAISDIPFHHIVGAVRVGYLDGKPVANPTYTEGRNSNLNIMVVGTEGGLVMVEAGASHATEEQVLECLEFGHDCCKKVAKVISEMVAKLGKTKRVFTPHVLDANISVNVAELVGEDLRDALDTKKYGKLESYSKIAALKAKIKETYAENLEEAVKCFEALKEQIFREDMSPSITAVVPMAANSTRSATSGSKPKPCRAPTVPPSSHAAKHRRLSPSPSAPRTTSSVSNSNPVRLPSASCCTTTSRRSASAKWASCVAQAAAKSATAPAGTRSAAAISIREVPRRLSAWSATFSNPTVPVPWPVSAARVSCFMDAGVPLTDAVSGVAMGLVMEGGEYAILTDIAGAEDHYGDMIGGCCYPGGTPSMDWRSCNDHRHHEGSSRIQRQVVSSSSINERLRSPRLAPRCPSLRPESTLSRFPSTRSVTSVGFGRQNHPQHHRTDRRQDRC